MCDFGDAYILVTGNVKITGAGENTNFYFKDPSPFTRSVIHLNDTHIEIAENLEFVLKHYSLIDYSGNYQDTVGFLYQYRRDERTLAGTALVDASETRSESFKYKSSLLSGIT